MASTELTEYEHQRLENIKRNGEMIASLKIHSTLSDLIFSKPRRGRPKFFKLNPEKKQKTDSIRQSLRARGKAPDSKGLKDKAYENRLLGYIAARLNYTPRKKKLAMHLGQFSTKKCYCGSGSDEKLIQTIRGFSKNSQIERVHVKNEDVGFMNVKNEDVGFMNVKNEDVGFMDVKDEVSGSIDLDIMKLEPKNIAKVVPRRIVSLKFFPIRDRRMVVVGNSLGKVGFWNVDSRNEEGDTDGIYVYKPHSGPVSGIAIQPYSMSKIITCCQSGSIQLMDVERETFDSVYSTTNGIYSISYQHNDAKSLYFGEGTGKFGIWDERSGISLSSGTLHDQWINTIDFNSGNTNLMATSSADGTACIWDLRNIDAKKPQSLMVIRHSRAVGSAYFSPSGNLLATTSVDNKIAITSGANYDDVSMIFHNNRAGRNRTSFRAVWGWDDSYLFVGSLYRGMDVISAAAKKNIATLVSGKAGTQSRLDAHPFNVGMLAGATSEGRVFLWNSEE